MPSRSQTSSSTTYIHLSLNLIAAYFRQLLKKNNITNRTESSIAVCKINTPGQLSLQHQSKKLRRLGLHFYKHGQLPSSNRGRCPKPAGILYLETTKQKCYAWLRFNDNKQHGVNIAEFNKYLSLDILPTLNTESVCVSRRTTRSVLHQLGYHHARRQKGIYVDGHESREVVSSRTTFLSEWFTDFYPRMAFYVVDDASNSLQEIPPDLAEQVQRLVAVFQDESTMYSYQASIGCWVKEGSKLLNKKGLGKSLMVSQFMCPCHGPLFHRHLMTDEDLAAFKGCSGTYVDVQDEDGVPDKLSRFPAAYEIAGECSHTGKHIVHVFVQVVFQPGKSKSDDGYWKSEDMEAQLKLAIKAFDSSHPGMQALFVLDQATNHTSYSCDSLRTSSVRMRDGCKVPIMRDGYFSKCGQRIAQPMFKLDNNNERIALGGKSILMERGLWREELHLKCKSCCDEGNCCVTSVLAAQPDFKEHSSLLEDAVRESGHLLRFLPKFHCEFSFVEPYWASVKFLLRERCEFHFPSFRKLVVPQNFEQQKSVLQQVD